MQSLNRFTFFICFALIAMLIPVMVFAQGNSPNLNVGGEVTFVKGNSPMLVAPSLTLTGPATIERATVVLDKGFVASEDRLGIAGQGNATSGTVNGIAWSYNETNGVLTLSGSATITAYRDTLRQVTYNNLSAAPAVADRTVSFSIGSSLHYENTGHYYEFVSSPQITWTNAKTAAEARSYYGLKGYLVTVMSAGENAFIVAKLEGDGWMGASDAERDKQWKWVTGPEAGTWFFTQQGYNPSGANTCGAGPASVQPPGSYTNWQNGEPNDFEFGPQPGCAGRENYGHFFTNGSWNDWPDSFSQIDGYLVEYGGMPGDPALSLSGQVTVHVIAGNSACDPYVSEAGDYSLVYHLEIPANADYNNNPAPYAANHANSIGKYDRVAYCLQLDDKWVWASMDDFTGGSIAKTGVPVASANPGGFQQRVDNMFVASNQPSVVSGPNIATGNIEFWHDCYDPPTTLGLPSASSTKYDYDDKKRAGQLRCYGSMQVHNYGARQTVFAYNAWDEAGADEAGIGNSAGQHPDWTFTRNAASYANRHLWVLVRESTLDDDLILHWDFEEGPGTGNCTAQDKTGHGHTGTLTNMDCTAAWSTDVPSNAGQTYSMRLGGAGSGDYVTSAPTSSADFPSGNSPRSLCSWVKSVDDQVDQWADHILNYGGSAEDQAFGFMIYTNQTHHWHGYFHHNDLDTKIRADTKWNHHCLVHNGSFATYYLNGTAITSGWTTVVKTAANTPMIAGVRPDLAGDTYFDGWVDDVRLYGRPLSADEVKALYQGKRPPVSVPPFYEWQMMTMDAEGGGWTSLALVNGRPGISYYGHGGGQARDLKYAWYDGTAWQLTAVDTQGDVGVATSLAEVNGQPAISYYDRGNRDLKYARYDGTSWQLTPVDTQGGDNGYTSLAVVNGQPAISYHDLTNGDLKYARFDGTSWQIATVDAGGTVGWWSSLEVVNGQPAISYYDGSNGDLKYARFDGTSWQLSTVDAQGDVGKTNSLAVVDGQPAISYYDESNGDLKYARFDGASWQVSTVDAGGTVGWSNSLAVVNGQPAISYYDAINGDLKYASHDGARWKIVAVATEGNVGVDSSLAVVNGQPAMSYYDATKGDLKYTWGAAPIPPADGNGDGIPDSQQPNVETVAGAAGFVTLAAPAGVTLKDVEAVQPSEAPPANVEVPQGLIGFEATGLSAGASFTMTLTIHDGPIATSFWKFGPTPDNPANHWYEFLYDATTNTGAEIKGRTIIVHYVDGKRGDSDTTANGVVVDPGGPGGRALNSFLYLPGILRTR